MPKLDLNRDELDVAIGARLRQLRITARMSLEAMGAAVHLTYQQIQKYETGANRISCSMLIRLCKALNCNPSHVLDAATKTVSTDALDVLDKIETVPEGPLRTTLVACVHGVLDAGLKELNHAVILDTPSRLRKPAGARQARRRIAVHALSASNP